MREELFNVPLPRLDRLMELRDALVALKGPLANDRQFQENLQKHLFNEETDCRVLGKISTPVPYPASPMPLGEAH